MTQENITKEIVKILVVDDVDANRFVLRDIIQEMGHQPVLAENGMQALKIMERIRPQLMILDIAMPGMDGYEFCKLMKDDPVTRNIPIIFISAFDDPADVVRGGLYHQAVYSQGRSGKTASPFKTLRYHERDDGNEQKTADFCERTASSIGDGEEKRALCAASRSKRKRLL